MSDMRDTLIATLSEAAEQFRKEGLEGEAANNERLIRQVDEPCVVAVVGQVKAGKSTFINALLGDDLARVGTTETTATINRFCYGNPDPHRPVRCYWRGGGYDDVDRAFLDNLQGKDIETLRRSDGIDYLEYFLPNAYLKHVTLVDTPGTGAIVEEHQNRTAEFMGLYNQLRARHHKDTERIGSQADAVIYLVGPVARATDQAFLEEFTRATGGRSRALNAIGVIAKIDIQPEVIDRRHALSEKISLQLKDQLNTVVPVSAGIRRALDHWLANERAGLRHLLETLARIPTPRLEKLLHSDEVFKEMEFNDCPVSAAERRELLGPTPWAVFATLARIAANAQLDAQAVESQLHDIAGFDHLKKILDQHFLQRRHLLHYYRIVEAARQELSRIRYKRLPELHQREREEQHLLQRFLGFIHRVDGDADTARELEDFLRLRLGHEARTQRLQALWEDLDWRFEDLYNQFVEYTADFGALQQLNDHDAEFSDQELDELRALLGLYGIESDKRLGAAGRRLDYVRERQRYWRQAEESSSRVAIRRLLAERAFVRYGLLIDELRQ